MSPASDPDPEICRLRVVIHGAVQGVGFRPFIFRLARELSLTGWVNNSSQGVFAELEGARASLENFLGLLQTQKPPRSFIQSIEPSWLDPAGYRGFEIRESQATGEKTALVMPDVTTCPDCLAEIFDPQNRRYFYPFTNCTHCGPRFSIIQALPYDRANTSMNAFRMCAQCQAEYDNPLDRRFHAQPNACPVCGPRLELWDRAGRAMAFESAKVAPGTDPSIQAQGRSADSCQAVLSAAAEAVRAGQIVAVKGVGGFHLMVSAGDESAVKRLRERKHRLEKPLAVMFPSMESIRSVCEVSRLEQRLLRSAEAPIVLLRRRHLAGNAVTAVTPAVAPGNPNLGVLLPYSPLHHLFLALVQVPVVATSGNLSDEPICIEEREALERLRDIADLFLVHDRPILRHVDDSIVRVMAGRELVLRRARGYAPLPFQLRSVESAMRGCAASKDASGAPIAPDSSVAGTHERALETLLAVGGQLKNTVALAVDSQIFVSQHIGDLETSQASGAFERVGADLQRLYDKPAARVVADAHPDYRSTRFAQQTGLPVTFVQHHVAHVLACMAENDLAPPTLGVAWDGTGYGSDATVWGGEFFRIHQHGYERAAHFRQFRLLGGEQAVREPRRSALAVLFNAFGPAGLERADLPAFAAFSKAELRTLSRMLDQNINSPITSSVGRLFDAIASLVGLRQRAAFEGQAAMDLEFSIDATSELAAYDVLLDDSTGIVVVDWRPALESLLADLKSGVRLGAISARFHNMLAESVVKVAQRIGLERVVLSGGCFQNRYLTEKTTRRLAESGFRPYWHQRIPPNDGGISVGQVVAVRWWGV